MIFSLMTLALIASGEPEGVIATARATPVPSVSAEVPASPEVPQAGDQVVTPHNLTTDEQIARWIDGRTPGQTFIETNDRGPVDDRKLHGEVGAGIGTGGYRDYSAWVSIPVGETGRLDLSYRETKNPLFPYYRDRAGLDRFYDDYDAPFRAPDAANRGEAWDERIRRQRSPAHPPSVLF